MPSSKTSPASRALQQSAPRRRRSTGNDTAQARSARPKLTLRNATPQDIPGIHALTSKVYAGHSSDGAYTVAQLRGHQHHFPQGQFVANQNLIAAAALIAGIPTLLVYILLQKQFIAGLSLGSAKG